MIFKQMLKLSTIHLGWIQFLRCLPPMALKKSMNKLSKFMAQKAPFCHIIQGMCFVWHLHGKMLLSSFQTMNLDHISWIFWKLVYFMANQLNQRLKYIQYLWKEFKFQNHRLRTSIFKQELQMCKATTTTWQASVYMLPLPLPIFIVQRSKNKQTRMASS